MDNVEHLLTLKFESIEDKYRVEVSSVCKFTLATSKIDMKIQCEN